MELTREEADFLFQKITRARASRDALLAYMLKERITASSFFELDKTILPEHLSENVRLVKDFANFIYGGKHIVEKPARCRIAA